MLTIDWAQFTKHGLRLKGKKSSMTVGVFDGIHRGHQALIEKVTTHAKKNGYMPVIITFRSNFKTGETSGGIYTFKEKIKKFKQMGVKITVVIDFTESFSRMTGIEFLQLLLKHGNVGFFAVGSNFRCGYQLDTDAAAIQKFFTTQRIPVEIAPEVMEENLPISSSRIRVAIAQGNLTLAEKMLGRTLKPPFN